MSISGTELAQRSLYQSLLQGYVGKIKSSEGGNYSSVDSMLSSGSATYETAGGSYQAAGGSSRYKLYVPQSGGGFREALEGETAEYLKRADGTFVHVSQVYQPVAEVRRAMGTMLAVLAVTFSTTQAQLAHMDAYIGELEKHNANLRSLQDAYQRCIALQTNMDQANENAVGLVDKDWLQLMAAAGVIDKNDTSSTFITGINPPVVVVRWASGPTGNDGDVFYTKFYLRRNDDGSFPYECNDDDGEKMLPDGYRLSDDEVRNWVRGSHPDQGKYETEEQIISFLDHGPIDVRLTVYSQRKIENWGSDAVCYMSTNGEMSNWTGIDDGGDENKNPNCWMNRDGKYGYVHYNNQINPMDPMFHKMDTMNDIITKNLTAYMPKRNLRSYMDILRNMIENEGNRMQIPNTTLSMVTKDMSAAFSLATGVVQDVGALATQVVRNTRL